MVEQRRSTLDPVCPQGDVHFVSEVVGEVQMAVAPQRLFQRAGSGRLQELVFDQQSSERVSARLRTKKLEALMPTEERLGLDVDAHGSRAVAKSGGCRGGLHQLFCADIFVMRISGEGLVSSIAVQDHFVASV